MSYIIEKDWETKAGLRAVVSIIESYSPGGGKYKHHRCGYVGVPKTSIYYGKDYSEQLEVISQEQADSVSLGDKSPLLLLSATCRSDNEFESVRRSLDVIIDCHGGLTYSGGNGNYPVESELWWFGFDCAHYGDATIDPDPFGFSFDDGVIRTLEFCEEQCEKIAEQLMQLETVEPAQNETH